MKKIFFLFSLVALVTAGCSSPQRVYNQLSVAQQPSPPPETGTTTTPSDLPLSTTTAPQDCPKFPAVERKKCLAFYINKTYGPVEEKGQTASPLTQDDLAICTNSTSATEYNECASHIFANYYYLTGCKTIANEALKDICFTIYAKDTKQPGACELVANQNDSDTCYSSAAAAVNDSNVCLLVAQSGTRFYCVSQIAQKSNNIQLCNILPTSSEQGDCMRPMIKTASGCDQIVDPVKQYDCKMNAGINAKDIKICDLQPPQGDYGIYDWKDGCLNAYAIMNNDPAVCKLLSANSRYAGTCSNYFTKPTPQVTRFAPAGYGTLADGLYKYQIFYPLNLSMQTNPPFLPLKSQLGNLQNVAFVNNSKNYSTQAPYDFYLAVYDNSKVLSPEKWFASVGLPTGNLAEAKKSINGFTVYEFLNPGAAISRSDYFFSPPYVIGLFMGKMASQDFDQVVTSYQEVN